MENLSYTLANGDHRVTASPKLVGVVSSGNLEVMIARDGPGNSCEVRIRTSAAGFGDIWQAVLQEFHARHRLAGVRLMINDAGATPAVVALRLEQAVAAFVGDAAPAPRPNSFREATARQRIAGLLDEGSFEEFFLPPELMTSLHLVQLDTPAAWDDGVAIGCGRIEGHIVYVAAQEGRFLGGGVGEIHGAKISGVLQRALRERPAAVVLLLDSGGVRLHEANAGLIGVSEIMRGVLALREARIPVLALIGGANGCFGGMGIVARCCDAVIMSEAGRLGLSGPEVIETAFGVEEFDSRDRALVWRTTGGKHRYLMGDCTALVADEVEAFRRAAIEAMQKAAPAPLDELRAEHVMLTARLARFGGARDAEEIWRELGCVELEALSMADAGAFVRETAPWRLSIESPGERRNATRRGNSDDADPGHWRALVNQLFPGGHAVRCAGNVLTGDAGVAGEAVAVLGTTAHVAIGFEIALTLAAEIQRVIREHPRRPIVILIDTEGQRLRRREEVLGINSVMAHLAKSMALARTCGHATVALVYDQALSGGFIATGLMADACFALASATIRVMDRKAMARVMKISEARLEELSRSNPVLAPGPEAYFRMGALIAIWEDNLADQLARGLAAASTRDCRSALGLERKGRPLAHQVIQHIATHATPTA